MSKETLLFIHNDPAYLKAGSEILALWGYTVLSTTCPIEARKVLQDTKIDLAIIAARLADESNEKDFSGVEMAQGMSPFLPKIIVTAVPNLEIVWLALEPYTEKIEFVAKEDGPTALPSAVKEALLN